MEKQRNYGIDLLRLVLMFMVCVLHTLGQGGVLKNCLEGSINYNTYWFIEILAYCAVDAFALITGYTASNKPVKYEKIVNMWFQVFFYSFILTLVFAGAGIGGQLGLKEIIKSALPIIFNRFWYVTAYFGLFFAIPLLNKFIFSIDDKTAKKALIIIFILFSVLGVIGEPMRTYDGYSVIWLMVLYCIGALSNKVGLFKNNKTLTLILLWAMCIVVTWITLVLFGTKRLINYISPTILLSGYLMIILFSRMKLKGNIISKLSPLALGIYLFHSNKILWRNVIKDAFVFIVNKNILIGVLLVFGIASIICLSGLLVEFIRAKLAEWLKVQKASKKIVNLGEKILDKACDLLK